MFLNIPKLQTELTVKTDIEIPVHCERRNIVFLAKHNLVPSKDVDGVWICNNCNIETIPNSGYRCPTCWKYAMDTLAIRTFTIQKGTKLVIDRYYIRNGSENFDSVTFRYYNGKEKSRFWLKMVDALKIEFEDT
jgi:hypothetical protein